MRLAPSLLCLTALLAGGPAFAQAGGFPGSTIGIPADPFASNYPSTPPPRAPPPREVAPDPRVEGRPRRAVRVRRPAPLSEGLRPPADVPYR